MGSVNTLSEAETVIAGFSRDDKRRLLTWLAREVDSGTGSINKNSDVMNGVACVRDTRIPVWLLEQARSQGVSEADLLHNYPGLTAEDLVNAWDYVAVNHDVVDAEIAANESED